MRMLLVEDSPTLSDLIRLILTDAGHDVDAVRSAGEALIQLDRADYQLVISDLSLGPGMSGLELAHLVCNLWPRVGFILATGSPSDLPIEEVARGGVDATLIKPFSASELREVVTRVATVRGQ